MRDTFEHTLKNSEFSVFRDVDMYPSLNNIELFYLKNENNKVKINDKDIIDILIHNDNLKKNYFSLEKINNSVLIKRGTPVLRLFYQTSTHKSSLYVIPQEGNKKILVLKTYSWNWDKLSQYFAIKNEYPNIRNSYDLESLVITCNSLPNVFNNQHVKIKNIDTCTYNVRLTGDGFNKTIVQKWLDFTTNKKVSVVSIKSVSDDGGFHSYSGCDLQQYTIELKVKKVVKKTISLDVLKTMFEHKNVYRNGNDVIFVDYHPEYEMIHPARTTVLILDNDNIINEIINVGGCWFNYKDKTLPIRDSKQLKGYELV